MIRIKWGLKFFLLFLMISGMQVMAQDSGDTGKIPADIPGTTAVSNGAAAASTEVTTEDQSGPRPK